MPYEGLHARLIGDINDLPHIVKCLKERGFLTEVQMNQLPIPVLWIGDIRLEGTDDIERFLWEERPVQVLMEERTRRIRVWERNESMRRGLIV